MEFAKLEEVQGLKFQHALVVPRSSYTGSGLEKTLSSLVVSKYNSLIQYGGPKANFYHLQKVIDSKGVNNDNLVMTLEVDDNIVSMVSGNEATSTVDRTNSSNNSIGSGSSKLDLEDVLLIETTSSLYVYSLINHSYLYTYRKPSSFNKGVDRMWFRIVTEDESLMLLVVDGAGRLALINVTKGSLVTETRLLDQGLHHSGIESGDDTKDRVRLIGNVDRNRILIVTSSNKLYLFDLSVDNNNATDRNRVCELTIKPTGSGSDDMVANTLNGEYEMVGCHIVNDMVLLGIIVPLYDDNMVLMCNIDYGSSNSSSGNGSSMSSNSGNKELIPLGYCYNEFFLTRDEAEGSNGTNVGDEAWIGFKHIEKWDLFIAYSNRSTSTVLLTSNRRLREANGASTEEDNKSLEQFGGKLVLGTNTENTLDSGVSRSEYKVLLMSEGYCLESNDFENHLLGVFVYTNYKNEIYRNASLEDTPTLKDPVVVGLVIDSGDVSIFYVDRHIIGTDNEEEEIMCGLYSKERDVIISSSGADNYADEGSYGRSNEIGSVISDIATGHGKVALTRSGRVDGLISSANVQKFLEKYYKDGFHKYREDKRLFKLHEALCNSLEYFNSSVEHLLNADDNVGDGSPIRVSKSIKSGYNADCKLDKLKDYNLIIKKLLNIQQDLSNSLYKISVPGSPEDGNEGGTSGSETPLLRNADLNGWVNAKDTGKELMDKMYNLLDNLSLQSMESVSADSINEVESSLMYMNSCLNNLYKKFDTLENKLLDVHNQMVFNEIVGGYGTNTWLAKHSNQLPEPSPTHSPTDASYEGVSRAGRSTSVVERKLDRLVDDIVRLYNRPLLDLSSEFGNLGLRNVAPGVGGGTLGEGSNGFGGGTKLKYNNYDVLFKGAGGTINLPSSPSSEKTSSRRVVSSSRKPSSRSEKSKTHTPGSEPSDFTLGSGNADSTSAATALVSSKTFTAKSSFGDGNITGFGSGGSSFTGFGAGAATKPGSGTSSKDSLSIFGTGKSPTSFGITDTTHGGDKSDSAKTSITSIFGTSASGTSAPDKSVGIGGSAVTGDGAGKVKFGITTSLLSGYDLVPSSVENANTSGTATAGGIGGDAKASSAPSGGTSVFAGFNTNKSLLDIALNSSSQVANTATGTLGGAFPTTSSGGTAGGIFGGAGGSFLNSSNNAGISTGNLGSGNSSLVSPASPSPFRSGTTSPFGGNAGGSVSGSFTGAGNFATNSFPASGSVFGSNPASVNNSLYNQASGNTPGASSTSIFGANSGSVFGGGASSSGISFFGTNTGPVTNTTGNNSGGIFGSNPPAANLTGDLWGASRRSNPLD